MNILLVTYYFMPGFEGSTSYITIMAELLAKSGNNVWVITHKFEGIDYKTHPNIKLVFVSSTLSFDKKMKTSFGETVKFTLGTIRAGLKIIKNKKIDIVHSNVIAALAGSSLSFFTSKPHIMLINDLYSVDPNFWKEWKKQEGNSVMGVILGKLLEKILVKSRYSAIHTISDASKDDLIKFGVKKSIYIIHNAIPIREAETTKTNQYQFVSVGRLVFYKNIQVVIKAIKILKEKFPKIKLFIIGNGPYRDHLEKLVSQHNLQNNVTFKGHVSEEEKNNFIATSQALVFPSLFEGFGFVILEAFRESRPVLVSNIKPVSDIIADKKTGLIVSENDEKKWAEAIEFILKNKEYSSKMGENGRKVLEEKYSPEIMIEKILQMYNNVK